MHAVITTPLLIGSGVKDIYVAEERYALVVTAGGVNVVDLFLGEAVSSGTLPSEPSTLAADWTAPQGKLYIGTLTSGIFDMNYVLVQERGSDFSGSLVQRFTTATTPAVSDNQINDLDVISGTLLIGTNAGVDVIVNGTESASRTLVSGSKDVLLNNTGGGYWTTASGVSDGAVEVNYDLLSTTGTSIITVDYEYTSLTTPALPAEPPVDLSSTSRPSSLPSLAVATPGGVLVFEEVPGSEPSAQNKVLSAEDIISVDFAPGSAYDFGCLNAATETTLRVFDLASNTASGTHTVDTGTRGQTLATGTISIVRAAETDTCPA